MNTNPYSPPQAEVGGEAFEPAATPDYPLNPWLSMWTKPRVTIQQIVAKNPDRCVVLLACLAGISGSLDRASMNGSGDKLGLPALLTVAIVAGPLAGLIYLHLGAAILRWTGKWIGGSATSEQIRAAIAWSNIPAIFGLALWIPQLALFGNDVFTSEPTAFDEKPIVMLGFVAADATIGIWTIVLFLATLSEVQRFSSWKALGNVLLATTIIAVPIVTLAVGIASLA